MFQPLFLLPAPRLRCQLRRGCACPSGATVLDYDYDALGQMTRQRDEQGQRYFSYDVTGKTTGVYLDAARQQPLVTFAYDDRGFRVSKTAYANGVAKTTYYVRDVAGNVLAVYEATTGRGPVVEQAPSGGNGQVFIENEIQRPPLRTEVPLYGASRVGTLTRLADGSEDYRYELNDHLGDARVVFHRPTTTVETETMELSGVSNTAAFQSNNLYRAGGGYNSTYAARLTGTQPAGQELKRVLTVAKGDTITFSAVGKLQEEFSGRTSSAVQPYLLLGAAPTDELPKTGPEAQQRPAGSGRWPGKLAAGLGIVLNQHPTQQRLSLQGWLKYRVLDDQGNQVSTDIVYLGGQGYWQQLQLGVRVAQGGTVELIAGTSGTGEAAYFDNLRVEQTGGLIVQEQHQYAFGAPLPGLSYTVGNMRYRHGYQGQYTEKDAETGYESFELRLYNSRIGRWMTNDPYGQYDSPYVGMGNEPVAGIDPDGGWKPGVPKPKFRGGYGLKSAASSGFGGKIVGALGAAMRGTVAGSRIADNDRRIMEHGRMYATPSHTGYNILSLTPPYQVANAIYLLPQMFNIGAPKKMLWGPYAGQQEAAGSFYGPIVSLGFGGAVAELNALKNLPKTPLRQINIGKYTGWGEGQGEEAIQQNITLAQNLTKAKIQRMKNFGVTKEYIQKNLNSYNNSLRVGGKKLNNKLLESRKFLMEKILEAWD